uniref:Outer dense fiber of sperm tails 3B n=1 Tax=Meleagris gallopavo TaxID=9103 RepID=A0A803Y2N9_MELGA
MDGAWVGTWRPHCPRGLISAQFPSPGPQYSIPGTTGFVGHSPTKARAPAYTFRGTKPPAAESCGPGPCYFVEPAITRNGKYVAPGAHLRGRPTTETTVTPGPSDYRTEAANRHVFKCPPVQSMAFRREPLRTDRPPDSGSCGVAQSSCRCLQDQGACIHHVGLTKTCRGQSSEARAGRLQRRPGDTDQAPGACIHFWNLAFPLHNPSDCGIKQPSLEGRLCFPGTGGDRKTPINCRFPLDSISIYGLGLLPILLLNVSKWSKSSIKSTQHLYVCFLVTPFSSLLHAGMRQRFLKPFKHQCIGNR